MGKLAKRRDERPAMAEALRCVEAGAENVWVTWQNERLKLRAYLGPHDDDAEYGGEAVISRRGQYHVVFLMGRRKNGSVLRDLHGRIVNEDKIRAVVSEKHPRQ